jgi:hypothetical protein
VGDDDLTPILSVDDGMWVKADHLYSWRDAMGGKARGARRLLEGRQIPGIVSSGSRSSEQALVLAQIARALRARLRFHLPSGSPGESVREAAKIWAELVPHTPGYASVVRRRAQLDAQSRGWFYIAPGIESEDMIDATASQVRDIPPEVRRIVVAVGSGVSCAGLLRGIARLERPIPVLGVMCGGSPLHVLRKWAPGWQERLTLVPSGRPYTNHVSGVQIGGVALNAVYEAKAAPFLEQGDLLWVVGK